ncbi:MAG: cache domain-containing protein [Pseudomonadota bacterium]
MKGKTSISGAVFANMTIMAVISLGLIGGLWIHGERSLLRVESQKIRERMLAEKKEGLRTEVGNVVSYIRFMRGRTEERLKTAARDRVGEAHAAALNIYQENKDRRPDDEIKKMIRDALRPIRFNQGRGYFFILNLNGTNELFSDRPEMEGRNLLTMKDPWNEKTARSLIRIVREGGEGYYRYEWTKPRLAGRDFPKIAFVKHFAPFDWMIGTGEYLDDVETDIQREVIARIDNLSFGQEGYFFVSRWDGVTLTGPGRGRNMSEVADANGLKIVRELIRLAQGGNGFLQYVMPAINGKRQAEKISYVVGIPEWEWYVGAGVYIDEIEAAVQAHQRLIGDKTAENVTKIGVVMALLLVLSVLVAKRIARKTRANHELFSEFFRKAAVESVKIDSRAMDYTEFEKLAESANDMLDSRKKAEEALIESESKYRILTENTADIIGVVDRDLKLTYVNPNISKLVEANPGDLIGRPLKDLDLPAELASSSEEAFLTVIRTAEPLEQELEVVTRGEVRILNIRSWPEFDENGLVEAVAFSTRDITDSRKFEENYRMLFARMLDGFTLQEAIPGQGLRPENFRFLAVNPSFEGLTGRRSADIIGKTAREVLPGIEEEWLRIYERVVLSGEPAHFEYNSRDLDRYFEVTAYRTSPGQFACIFKDVTAGKKSGEERKKLEAQLLQSQKMEAIGTLAGGIAHDFNNILGVILGCAELSLWNLPPEDGNYRNLRQIIKSSRRARDLVTQILTFGRKNEQTREPVDLRPIIKETLKFLRSSLPSTIAIDQDIEDDIGLVRADPTQMHQVFMNLCANAAQAMAGQGGELFVRLSAVEVESDREARAMGLEIGRYLRLEVSDTGQGMTPEVKERIFEPYFTTKGAGEGTGLGLAVVHGIVAGHQGVVKVYSEPEKGSSFSVFLPLVDRPERGESEVRPGPIPTGTERVLTVDDEPSLVELGREMLSRLGYQVAGFSSGPEALAAFRADPSAFDLVLTDQTMPGLTGLELLEEVKKIRPDIPVIICTGFSRQVNRDLAARQGADGFLLKPLDMRTLAVLIRQCLEKAGAAK